MKNCNLNFIFKYNLLRYFTIRIMFSWIRIKQQMLKSNSFYDMIERSAVISIFFVVIGLDIFLDSQFFT